MFSFYAEKVGISFLFIPFNGYLVKKKKGPPPLLFPRRKCPRRRPTSHRPSGLSRHRRKTRRTRPAKVRSGPPFRHLARLRPPRRLVAGGKTVRRVAAVGLPVALSAFRTRSCSLSSARGHSPHLRS